MFYKPEKGGIWDPTVFYKDGYYYMASMYFMDESNRRDDYMHLAKSKDGVHWQSIGPVIEDKRGVCKMFVYMAKDGCFVADYGSFSDEQRLKNDTLCYYRSRDLLSWEKVGENHPDVRYYNNADVGEHHRWDHMYVYHQDGVYYGYPVAIPHPHYKRAWGLCISEDGYKWEIKEPPIINWGDIPPIDCLEIGGMERIGDKYYLIAGFVGYAGNRGYSVYTFVANSPLGPFEPVKDAFRLCGSSGEEYVVFRQALAAFAKCNGEVLISNSVIAGGGTDTWLLPLREAVIDQKGNLQMGYWKANDLAKGEEIDISDTIKLEYCRFPASQGKLDGYFNSEFEQRGNGFYASTDAPDGINIEDHSMLIMLDKGLDLEQGVFLEAVISARSWPKHNPETLRTLNWRPVTAGVYFELDEGGIYAYAEVSHHEYKRRSCIEKVVFGSDKPQYHLLDVVAEGCAGARGMDAIKKHTLKVIYRKNMFEIYIDRIHMQTFVINGVQSGRMGFLIRNAEVTVENIKLYKLTV